MPDGKVTFQVEVDANGAKKSIDQIVNEFKDAGVQVDKVTENMGSDMSKSFTKAFDIERVKNYAIQAAKSIAQFGKDAIAAASDLQEVQNVVDTTFGDSAGQINKWAQNAGKQFGLTETQAKRFASTLGAMMKSAGMAGPEITEMSTKLAGLAADMASFYNLDFDTAFQKIRSGISGEVEPLKALGINLSVANLEAFALEKGLTKSFNAMSQSEQIMLRYEYLMQATADAQGDFARTSDGYANSVRMMETNLEQLKTNIGTALLPVVNDVIGAVNAMFGVLQQDLPPDTVLDKFAAIDLKTADKIAEIEATAAKANQLVTTLDEITGKTYATNGLVEFVASFGGSLGDLDAAMEQAKKGNYAGTMEELAKALELKTGVSADQWTQLFSGISAAVTNANIDATKITEPVGEIKGAVEDGITTGKLGTDIDNVIKALNKDPAKSKIPGEDQGVTQNPGIDGANVKTGMDDVVAALNVAPAKPAPVAEQIANIQAITAEPGINAATLKKQVDTVKDALETDADLKIPDDVAKLKKSAETTINYGTLLDNTQAIARALETKAEPKIPGAIDEIKKKTDDPGITGTNVSAGISEVKTALETEAPESMPVVEGVSEFAEAVNQEFDASGVESATKQAADALGVAPAQPQGKIPVVVALEDLEGSLAAAGQVIGESGGTFTSFLEAAASAANGMGPEATKNWELFVKTVGSAQAEKMLQSWAEAGTAASNMAAVTNAMSGTVDAEGMAAAIANLAEFGVQVRDGEDAMEIWLDLCGQLVAAIPSLGDVINTQTGELSASTDEIKAQIEAWKELREEAAIMEGWREKQRALENDTGVQDAQKALVQAKMDLQLAQQAWNQLVEKSGLSEEEYTKQATKRVGPNGMAYADYEGYKAYTDLADAQNALTEAEAELTRQTEAYNEAQAQLEEGLQNATGSFDEAAEAAGAFSSETQAAVNAALESMAPALEEMAAMYESTRSSIESSVNNMMDGFEFKMPKIEKPTETFDGMDKSLSDQIDYMNQYMAMLDTLKQRGVSADLLGDLSSGSQEDFEYLSGLMTATDQELTEMNSKYAEAKAKREEFVNSLTETNLEGDETFAALAEQVQTDMDTLTTALSESGAPAAAEATFQAILDAVTSRSASISQAIDEVVANWAKLEGLGFSGFGTGNGAGSSNGGGTPHAGGLDYVPFNGYMARLHEGESVLTAEQSRAWRSMMDGPGQNSSGLDYGALGGVIRDNTARSAGNVYLDGKTLGKVISDQQANSYNNLSRSGWSG